MVDESKRGFLKGIAALAALAATGGLEAIAEAVSPVKNSRAINIPVNNDFLEGIVDFSYQYRTILGDNKEEDDFYRPQIEQALAKEKEGTCRIIEKKDVRIRRCTRVIHEDAEIRYVKPKHVDVSINVSEGKTERHIKSKESKSVTESDSFDGESNTLTHTTTEHILVNRSHDYPKYVMRDNEVLRILAGKISEDYLTLEEKAQALICFVQTAIAYDDRGLPKGDMDYVKNPIKTLMDRKGDCKDKSVLYASLLTYIGVNPVFITYKNHVNVGVPLDFENNRVAPEGMVLDGKVKHKGKTYFIVETTLDNPCYIGRLNKSGKNRKIREIFPLN